MKKAVIFDLDGTLANSIPFHFNNHKNNFKTVGVHLTRKFFDDKCNGTKPSEFYQIIIDEFNIPKKYHKKLFALEKKEEKLSSNESYIKVFSGVKLTLKKLKKENFLIAVASSASKSYVKSVLKNNNITKYFDVIVGGDEVNHSKPNPHIFLLARKRLNIKKSECVIVEDATNGVIAAKRAKIDCLCMLTSEKKEDIPKYAKIVKKHSQLFDVISKL